MAETLDNPGGMGNKRRKLGSREYKCGVLRDLVPFVQFKKREKTHGEMLLLVKLQAWL